MTFPKRTFEKPIPISPLIALDRERCILCYRCTRFTEEVAEDGQLVAVNRGAQSVIATFEDEPYRGHVLRQRDRALPGRRADLDAVPLRGAAVGDPERADRLRPLPGRLQHQRDDARGQGQAHPLAQPPRGRRGLALRQGPLRVRAPRTRATASRRRSRKAGPRRFEQLSWDDALDEAERTAARRRRLDRDGALGRRVGRGGLRAREAAAPGARRARRRAARGVPDGFDACRAPLSALRDAKTIAVLCDEPVVERAPIVDLWLKAARRAGATITYGAPDRRRRRARHRRRRDARGVDARRTSTTCRCTPNGRGVADAWSAAGDGEPVDEKPRLLIISGDEAATDPAVRAMAADAEFVIGIGMFEESFRGIADLVLPGHELPRARRHDRQPRGPAAAPAPRRARAGARTCSPGSRSSPSASSVELSPHASVVFDEISRTLLRRHHVRRRRRARRAAARAPKRRAEPARRVDTASRPAPGLRLVAYRPLFSGAAVERTPELQFQRPDARGRALAPTTRRARGIRNGADRHRLLERHVRRAARAHRARPRRRYRAHRRRTTPADLHAIVEVKP